MALGISSNGGGDFLPIIKLDARNGRAIRVDRHQIDGEWAKEETVLDEAAFAADLANVEVGWLAFPGGIPDFHLVRYGQPVPPQPGDDYRPAFRVNVILTKACRAEGEDNSSVRELSHSAKTVINAFDRLHDAFLAAEKEHEGKVPLIAITGWEEVKYRNGNIGHAPVFTIREWVKRPDAFDEAIETQERALVAAKVSDDADDDSLPF